MDFCCNLFILDIHIQPNTAYPQRLQGLLETYWAYDITDTKVVKPEQLRRDRIFIQTV